MSSQRSPRLLIALVAGVYAAIVCFHVASARSGHSHIRAQHVATAVLFAKEKIDLLRPVIWGFNANGTATPLELPIWQALAACLFRSLGPWFGWANLLSLALFTAGLWPLHRLAREYLGARGAWWALLFFLAQPLIVVISGQASVDGLALVCATSFVFCAERLVRTQRLAWLLPSAFFGSLSILTKLPFFMQAGLVSALLLFLHAPRAPRAWLLLAATAAICGGVFALWTRHTNILLAQGEFPEMDLRMFYHSDAWYWYFGDWHYRLNPLSWIKGGWAALNVLFGSSTLAGLAGWSLFFSRNRLGQFSIAAAFVVTLVFAHLVLFHRHYFILYSPGVAILAAGAIVALEERVTWRAWQWHCAELGVGALLFLGSVQGLLGMEVVQSYDPFPQKMADIIASKTTPADKLVIQGGGWGGDTLLFADRTGLSTLDPSFLGKEGALRRLRELGYTKLVMISESPLLHALQLTNPGSLSRQRETYHRWLPAAAAEWKTVVQDEDLLIKELPEVAP